MSDTAKKPDGLLVQIGFAFYAAGAVTMAGLILYLGWALTH